MHAVCSLPYQLLRGTQKPVPALRRSWRGRRADPPHRKQQRRMSESLGAWRAEGKPGLSGESLRCTEGIREGGPPWGGWEGDLGLGANNYIYGDHEGREYAP